MRLAAPLAALVIAVTAAAGALAQAASTSPDKGENGDKGKPAAAAHHETAAERSAKEEAEKTATAEVAAGWARAPVTEREVITHHSVATPEGELRYAATAGTLTIRDDEGKPTASIFFVAYTLENPPAGRPRPVTFFYNGGPGSSSMWLHMGSLAPVRVTTGNPEFIRPAPYGFGPNPHTLLDKTDMVFIDAPGTGYSRALGDTEPKTFWGVDADCDAFARAIFRYVDKYQRWGSPKFLFGESYGTTRSALLAWKLQDRGMALNGVVLLSSILNFGIRQPGYDEQFIGYLPTYAAAAWYHHKLANPPADVEQAIAAARDFAFGPYAAALAKGDALPEAERNEIATQMAALTGLSPTFIEDANLRVEPALFRKELLRDQRLTIGRYDSRYTGVDASAVGATPDYDASDAAISAAFIAAINNYLGPVLGYRTDMTYRPTIYGMEGFKWDWKHKAPGQQERFEQTTPDVAVDLAAAMRTNPYLRVLSLNGYFDMATPFSITEYDLSHMMLEPAERANVEFRYYPSGHMAYLNPEVLVQMHADLSAFYDEAVASAASGAPPHAPVATSGRGRR
ncbi:MAG TPA: peptidase S10 [Caulobacteraceae bacterium]|nr:peptidase S10 [Caulobacteraceae bacterium]